MTENLQLERAPWTAADKLRNNMDDVLLPKVMSGKLAVKADA